MTIYGLTCITSGYIVSKKGKTMRIAETGTYYAFSNNTYQKKEQIGKNDFYGNISFASELTKERNDSKVLGITMIPEEDSLITYGMRAQYAVESTEAAPIVQVTSNYGGKSVSYLVSINEVDPKNASQLEMFALCSYADDKGISDGGTFGSYQHLEYNAQHNGYCNGMGGTDCFVNSKFKWEEIVSKMMEDYLKAGVYRQYQDGVNLMSLFQKFSSDRTV